MKQIVLFLCLPLMVAGMLAGCGRAPSSGKPTSPVFHTDTDPQLLSDWGLFDLSKGGFALQTDVVPYDLNTPLFTDYAHKLRTIWIEGEQAGEYISADAPEFPVGTVISKTFYYPRTSNLDALLKLDQESGRVSDQLQNLDQVKLVETRLLVRRASGWHAVSYIWNSDQTEATLSKIGAVETLKLSDETGQSETFSYVVPNTNQCAGCHAPNNTTRKLAPLGVRPRHINKAFEYSEGKINQLDYLVEKGYLRAVPASELRPQNANWLDAGAPLVDRARAYLDVNCSHCHNPVGPADTSGLDLTIEAREGEALGFCKLPIAAGSGTGDRLYGIVPGEPGASILVHRMETTDPAGMMPELGRSLSHQEGVELVKAWIMQLDGTCAN